MTEEEKRAKALQDQQVEVLTMMQNVMHSDSLRAEMTAAKWEDEQSAAREWRMSMYALEQRKTLALERITGLLADYLPGMKVGPA